MIDPERISVLVDRAEDIARREGWPIVYGRSRADLRRLLAEATMRQERADNPLVIDPE